MIAQIKGAFAATLAYLSEAGHRRFVSVIAAMLVTHFLGRAIGADDIANAIDIVIGGFGGAWTAPGSPT